MTPFYRPLAQRLAFFSVPGSNQFNRSGINLLKVISYEMLKSNWHEDLCPVFRIHDILGWIRILGSMLLNNGFGSCYFRH
jgi:hypothetical protein